jgi:hypothetical protein
MPISASGDKCPVRQLAYSGLDTDEGRRGTDVLAANL